MKRDLFGVCTALLLAVASAHAQSSPGGPGPGLPNPAPTGERTPPGTPRPAPPPVGLPRIGDGPDERAGSREREEEVTVTGCLVEGSGPNVYILQTQPIGTAESSDQTVSYVVTAASDAPKIDFRSEVNRAVRLTGARSGEAASAIDGAQRAPDTSTNLEVKELEMPKLSVKRLARIGDRCTAGASPGIR